MAKSVLEEEITRKLAEIKSSMVAHDRGVMLGFLLSLFPLFPVAFFGFLISLTNYLIWKSGKLDLFEKGLIRKGLILGFINTLIGIAVLSLIINFLFGLDLHQYPAWVYENLSRIFHWTQPYSPKDTVAI